MLPDRREAPYRRQAERRVAVVAVAVERRSGADRRAIPERRSGVERRVLPDRRRSAWVGAGI
jgi:hypothetical protein